MPDSKTEDKLNIICLSNTKINESIFKPSNDLPYFLWQAQNLKKTSKLIFFARNNLSAFIHTIRADMMTQVGFTC
jgi:hypothetical protein